MPDKGLTTAQLKKLYMKTLKGKQAAEQKGISSKNFVRMYMAYNGDANTSDINKAVNRLEGIREESVYKPQREKASARFDKNTKFDDLLGRSTNPDKKFDQGGIMKAKKKMYKGGGKVDAALRAELKKRTSKAKPQVKTKDTPMERINKTSVRKDTYKEVSNDLVAKTGMGRTRANQYAMATIDATTAGNVRKAGKEAGAKTYGELADAVEKKYKFGGKIYKDGGRALFEALKKKFGEG